MPKFKDLTGMRFGKVLVLERANSATRRTKFKCKCDCGNTSVILSESLVSGNTKSCGCLHAEKLYKHGNAKNGSRSREYNKWNAAKQRCINPKDRGTIEEVII